MFSEIKHGFVFVRLVNMNTFEIHFMAFFMAKYQIFDEKYRNSKLKIDNFQ